MVDRLYSYKLLWNRVEKQDLANSEVGPVLINDDVHFLKKSTAESVVSTIRYTMYWKIIRCVGVQRGRCL